jgi:Ala-tRNA(Pro) deacylase
MSMPSRLSNYLQRCGASYDLCSHPHSRSSAETARSAHVTPHQLAKSVILEDDAGCVMAVVPGDARVRVGELSRLLGRPFLHLADEPRIAELFDDCRPGAVPALGMPWGVETVVDDDLDENGEVYVEGGDHESLLRMSGDQFNALMRGLRHWHFCRRAVH